MIILIKILEKCKWHRLPNIGEQKHM